MRFRNKDKKYLLDKIYGGDQTSFEADLPQMEWVADGMKYERYKGDTMGRSIGRKRAIELCGREGWLSGIARAAFHMTAIREVKGCPNCYVGFDAHGLFR